MCDAQLFPLEPPRDLVSLVVYGSWASGLAVHPLLAPYGPGHPVYGPQPAVCVRDGEHIYHWDGKGTWWESRVRW